MNYEDEERFCTERISIEPDLDPRRSTDKALPAPPKTPKRVLMKYRFSAVFPILFAGASFVLALVIVLAGRGEGSFSGGYLVALNTSGIRHDPISDSPSSALKSEDPGIADVYYMYLRSVCSRSRSDEPNTIIVEKCESYSEAGKRFAIVTNNVSPLNQTAPPTAYLTNSFTMISSTLSTTRTVVFASLLVVLTTSSLSILYAIPSIFYPHSRLLVYTNMTLSSITSTFALVTAIICTVLIFGISTVISGPGDINPIPVQHNSVVLLFVWLGWLGSVLQGLYWCVVWFVEMRQLSFSRRVRSEEEVGNWRFFAGEVWRCVRG